MNKKIFALFSVLLVVAFALTACGPAATEAPVANLLAIPKSS